MNMCTIEVHLPRHLPHKGSTYITRCSLLIEGISYQQYIVQDKVQLQWRPVHIRRLTDDNDDRADYNRYGQLWSTNHL